MREVRPDDWGFYVEPGKRPFKQGDIFAEVPLAFPFPPNSVTAEAGARKFLSGPFESGPAMLLTPTCSMSAQQAASGYAHPVRTLVPLLNADDLLDRKVLDNGQLGLARKYDQLINYMYLPSHSELGFPESLALLYMPITLHHDVISDQPRTGLGVEAAKQLQRKLVWFTSGALIPRDQFTPP